MGLDGGTKISRSDVLRGSSWRVASADSSRSTRGGAVSTSALLKKEELDAQSARESCLACCSLSGQDLNPQRIVCDFLGNLYDKEAYLAYIIAKKGVFSDLQAKHRFQNVQRTRSQALKHLKSASSVFDVHSWHHSVHAPPDEQLCQTESSSVPDPKGSEIEGAAQPTTPPSTKALENESTSEAEPAPVAPVDMLCPILHVPFRSNRCVVLTPCGHMLSYAAIQMLDPSGLKHIDDLPSLNCPLCDAVFSPGWDMIEICPNAHEIERLNSVLPLRKKRKHAATSTGARKLLGPNKVPKLTLQAADATLAEETLALTHGVT